MLGKAVHLVGGSLLLLAVILALHSPLKVKNAVAQYPTATNTPTPNPTPFEIYGYVYTEKNDLVDRTTAVAEGLVGGRPVTLSGDASANTTSLNTDLGTPPANYQFTPVYSGIYLVTLTLGSARVLYNAGGFTNPQVAVVAGAPVIVDFPLVTPSFTPAPNTPTPTPPGEGLPTFTPTPTVPLLTPTSEPTPTSAVNPDPCLLLPTPILLNPPHTACMNTRPVFQTDVSDPNGDNVWAHYYSNAYETFSENGSSVTGSGTSQWTPQSHHLTNSGGYWWTAFTESPLCPKSSDAPSRIIYMDYAAPPQPIAPTCSLINQDYVSGVATFSCLWDPVVSVDGTCGEVNDYSPIFWTQPNGLTWYPGWIGNTTTITVVTEDGQQLFAQVRAREDIGNVSLPSSIGGPFVAPKLNFSFTPTPGPSLTPAPTVTLSPTPFITTPGPWIQIQGGDVFQESINQMVPTGAYFLESLPTPTVNPNSIGIVWSTSGTGNFGEGRASVNNWQVAGTFTNPYQFSFYWNQLKDRALAVNNAQVGREGDLWVNDTVYLYSGTGLYTLAAFTPETPHTIFLISGSFEITSDFSIGSDQTVTFIVNGNVFIGPDVTRIPGLYIVSQSFTVADSVPPGTIPLTIDGMLYANTLNLARSYSSFNAPTLLLVYQPKYLIQLLPYLGRSQVNWREIAP